jgi:hypothetical protein
MPITSEPAPSLRPWASATGATPLRTMFNLTCPPKCWVKIGHFYFAGNRTFLLCLDTLSARKIEHARSDALTRTPPNIL